MNLGVAFTGLVQEAGATDHVDIYPCACSTAAKTEMILGLTLRSFDSLQDRCRAVVARCLNVTDDVNALPLPTELKKYIRQALHFRKGNSVVQKCPLIRSQSMSGNLFRRRVKQQLNF